MTDEGSESAWDNFGKFIYQFQPETRTLIKKNWIVNKLYRENVYLLFIETCLNQRLPSDYTRTHTHTRTYTHIYIYIYIYICIYKISRPKVYDHQELFLKLHNKG